jgi:predicted metal-dependent phosphoesterase TrpH
VSEERADEKTWTESVPVLGKADLHIHSAAGDALPTPLEILDYVEEHTDLDLIAITDHDDVSGALEARELAERSRYRFEVIVGTEVTTLAGHLLALFVEERLPMFQSLEKTIEAVHRQGGLCVVPHPMSWLTFSVGEGLLRRHGRHQSRELCFDGLEGFNPSVAGWVCHKRVRDLNQSLLGLPELGGSDAHQLVQIGTAYTLFNGRDARDFRRSLKAHETVACGAFWSASFHLHGAAEQSWKSMVVHPSQKLYRAIGAMLGAQRSTSA